MSVESADWLQWTPEVEKEDKSSFQFILGKFFFFHLSILRIWKLL